MISVTNFQQQKQPQQQQQQQTSQTSTTNWNDTMSLEVLPVRCKTTTAELFKSRLGSGGRGRCIKYKDQWFTPSEFENLCGRGSSKDWKRSIRFGGRSLQVFIYWNHLPIESKCNKIKFVPGSNRRKYHNTTCHQLYLCCVL